MDTPQDIEETSCPVDVPNASAVSPNGSSSASNPSSLESFAASLAQVVSQLLQMHNELLATVGTLVQQNERMLEALGMAIDDDEDEPRTYLDGTPVDRAQ